MHLKELNFYGLQPWEPISIPEFSNMETGVFIVMSLSRSGWTGNATDGVCLPCDVFWIVGAVSLHIDTEIISCEDLLKWVTSMTQQK